MWQDPIVEEVRKEREAFAASLNYDIKAIVAELRKQQEANADNVVDFSAAMTSDTLPFTHSAHDKILQW